MIGLALMMLAGAAAQTSTANPLIADPKRLHQIDQRFQCPETLRSERAKVEAIARFDHDVALAVQNLTVERLVEIRMYLLRKHRCYVTLRNIHDKASE